MMMAVCLLNTLRPLRNKLSNNDSIANEHRTELIENPMVLNAIPSSMQLAISSNRDTNKRRNPATLPTGKPSFCASIDAQKLSACQEANAV